MTTLSRTILTTLRTSLVPIFVVSILSGLVYVVGQQNLRMNANDPQIQLAEDAARKIQADEDPESLIPPTTVDISHDLAPYVILYDDAGEPLAGSGLLDNKLPSLPKGVFEFTRVHGEDRITWQPRIGVRSAAVIVRIEGAAPGFILAGRSLSEVESREDRLALIGVITWIISLFGIVILKFFTV